MGAWEVPGANSHDMWCHLLIGKCDHTPTPEPQERGGQDCLQESRGEGPRALGIDQDGRSMALGGGCQTSQRRSQRPQLSPGHRSPIRGRKEAKFVFRLSQKFISNKEKEDGHSHKGQVERHTGRPECTPAFSPFTFSK